MCLKKSSFGDFIFNKKYFFTYFIVVLFQNGTFRKGAILKRYFLINSLAQSDAFQKTQKKYF